MTVGLLAYWNKIPNDIFEFIELTTDDLDNYDFTNEKWFKKSIYKIYQIYLNGMEWIDNIRFPIRVIIGRTLEYELFLLFEKNTYTFSHTYLENKIIDILNI
jgi:hypothetical protein